LKDCRSIAATANCQGQSACWDCCDLGVAKVGEKGASVLNITFNQTLLDASLSSGNLTFNNFYGKNAPKLALSNLFEKSIIFAFFIKI
jgi:hypothetical protein